jgi:recombinational DNA repair protein RecR
MVTRFIKVMKRELTREENKEIIDYLVKHSDEDIRKVILMFEEKYDTPITNSYIKEIIKGIVLRIESEK